MIIFLPSLFSFFLSYIYLSRFYVTIPLNILLYIIIHFLLPLYFSSYHKDNVFLPGSIEYTVFIFRLIFEQCCYEIKFILSIEYLFPTFLLATLVLSDSQVMTIYSRLIIYIFY